MSKQIWDGNTIKKDDIQNSGKYNHNLVNNLTTLDEYSANGTLRKL